MRSLRSGKNPRGPVTRDDVNDLVESFSRGAPQLHNVVVRPIPGSERAWEIVAGHRRVEAARKLGWSHVEAKIVVVDDATAEALALEENLKRRALPDETTAIARLIELYGAPKRGRPRKLGHGDRVSPPNSVDRVAQMAGLSPREVRRKAKIGREGSPKLRDALASGRIGLVVAEQLAGLDHKEQDRQLRQIERPRRGKQVEVVPEIQRAIDSLDHAARVITTFGKGRLPAEVLARLKERHQAVGSALALLSTGQSPVRKSPVPTSKASADAAVKVEPISYNRKLACVAFTPHTNRARPHPMPPFVAATSVSMLATCPPTCAFRGSPTAAGGCYVDAGFTKIGLRKLDQAAARFSAEEVVAAEVRALDDLFDGGPVPQDGARGGRDLRLHVGGDVGSTEGAKMLAKAARRWRARGGGSVWSYTHRWREVPHGAWGEAISILASVENPDQIEQARRRGYASVIVVSDFPRDDKAFTVQGTSVRIVPCPAETRDGITCAECRLCMRDLLDLNVTVAFKVHGQHAEHARAAIR